MVASLYLVALGAETRAEGRSASEPTTRTLREEMLTLVGLGTPVVGISATTLGKVPSTTLVAEVGSPNII